MKSEALKKLSQRQLHSAELKSFLIKKGHDCSEVEALIEEFIAKGYLSDEEWEEGYFRQALRKGLSPLEVKGKLMQKGIEAQRLIERLKNREEELIENIVRRRYKTKEPDQIRAALARKGFSYDSISKFFIASEL